MFDILVLYDFHIAFLYFFGWLSLSLSLSFSFSIYLPLSLSASMSIMFLQIWNIWRKFKFSSYELYIFGISWKRTPYSDSFISHFQVNFECFNRQRMLYVEWMDARGYVIVYVFCVADVKGGGGGGWDGDLEEKQARRAANINLKCAYRIHAHTQYSLRCTIKCNAKHGTNMWTI